MAALVVIVAALDSTGGRLTLIEGHSGLTGGCTNNASTVETKAEQWKKWGRSLKTREWAGWRHTHLRYQSITSTVHLSLNNGGVAVSVLRNSIRECR